MGAVPAREGMVNTPLARRIKSLTPPPTVVAELLMSKSSLVPALMVRPPANVNVPATPKLPLVFTPGAIWATFDPVPVVVVTRPLMMPLPESVADALALGVNFTAPEPVAEPAELVTLRLPWLIVTVAVLMFEPVRVTVPAPTLETVPPPLICALTCRFPAPPMVSPVPDTTSEETTAVIVPPEPDENATVGAPAPGV